jgi:hypothetical protein
MMAAAMAVGGDHPAGPAGQADHGRDGGQVVAHDDGVGGVEGEVGPGPAHRDAGVRGGQGGGVVDAVTGEQDPVAGGFQPGDGGNLVLRQQARANVVDADLPG